MAIRSGRFRTEFANVGDEITIVKGRTGAFYRIFNSGKTSFTVKHGGADLSLHPTFSVDVATKGGAGGNAGDVVIAALVAGEVVEGIYDYLDTQNPQIRSGRFNSIRDRHDDGTVPTTTNPRPPTTQHPIIDFAGGTPTGWYRILNSGDNTIRLEVNSAAPLSIKKEQSFDFAVKNNDRITVKSTAADKHIDCIYEFLGKS